MSYNVFNGAIPVAQGGTGSTTATNARAALGLGTMSTQAASAVAITGGTITGLGSPSVSSDAATKGYVDSVTVGLLDFKNSVVVATTAALPANTRTSNVLTADANGAFAAVDGITLSVNDRILVKDEATGANNGIYTLTAVGDAGNPWTLTRATDADADAEVTAGLYVFVDRGTVNADSAWVLTSNDVITLNTTALTFVQFSGAGQITAGNGLSKAGNTLDVITDNSTIEINTDALRIKAGGVGNSHLANTAVTPAKADLTQAWAFTGKLSGSGGFALKRTATATAYTALVTDTYVGVTDTSAPRTITLPAAASAGSDFILVIKDESGAAATNNITVDGNASENIDGATTKVISTNYGSVTIMCDGTQWFVI